MAAVTRRRFDPEFRAGAVRIVKETGKPVAHVARLEQLSYYPRLVELVLQLDAAGLTSA